VSQSGLPGTPLQSVPALHPMHAFVAVSQMPLLQRFVVLLHAAWHW
jgi:hypothetical protein